MKGEKRFDLAFVVVVLVDRRNGIASVEKWEGWQSDSGNFFNLRYAELAGKALYLWRKLKIALFSIHSRSLPACPPSQGLEGIPF